VQARQGTAPHDEGALAAARRAEACLRELAPLRAVASSPIDRLRLDPKWPPTLQLMFQAASAVGEPAFTPMVAVAGAVAQLALEAAIAAGAGTVLVENGGDLAVTVEPGDEITIGVARSLVDRTPSHVLAVTSSSLVRGVCTSGLGGRSFTRGIAEAATAASTGAALADACATCLANATYVASPLVEQRLARELDPDTDIPELSVTTRVGPLPPSLVRQALDQASAQAERLRRAGLLLGAVVSVQGLSVVIPEGFAHPFRPPALTTDPTEQY